MGLNRALESNAFDSISAFSLSARCGLIQHICEAGGDLRRREILFWFFVLSYIPGILLIIVIVNVFENDVPEHIGMYFSAAWLAGFAGTGFYRQNFRRPRCPQFFFRRFLLAQPSSLNCGSCQLARRAPGR